MHAFLVKGLVYSKRNRFLNVLISYLVTDSSMPRISFSCSLCSDWSLSVILWISHLILSKSASLFFIGSTASFISVPSWIFLSHQAVCLLIETFKYCYSKKYLTSMTAIAITAKYLDGASLSSVCEPLQRVSPSGWVSHPLAVICLVQGKLCLKIYWSPKLKIVNKH